MSTVFSSEYDKHEQYRENVHAGRNLLRELIPNPQFRKAWMGNSCTGGHANFPLLGHYMALCGIDHEKVTPAQLEILSDYIEWI